VKTRLDRLLVERGFAQTRSKAQDLIRRGAVRLEGRVVLKTGLEVAIGAAIEVLENKAYVARSALKLVAALDRFGFSPDGRLCLDVGASTGGFTEVLLERGARQVFAVDVGRGQLHGRLRMDARVVSMEATDARSLIASAFPSKFEAIVCDVSFISLLKILPPVLRLGEGNAWFVGLVKPQFEVGPALVGKGGIVKDAEARAAAVDRVADFVRAAGWNVQAWFSSPLAGQDGNEETLLGATREN
jgi:23S rRNA (cytidine1920-2'-O)/16S rRNA (cytidine1409-2'-O)-methyltransferase